MLSSVALVGRPNVGKSTLFNALTRSRDALVHDQPGVTRDRHYGVCRPEGLRPFVVVDTGGIAGVEEGLAGATARQARAAAASEAMLRSNWVWSVERGRSTSLRSCRSSTFCRVREGGTTARATSATTTATSGTRMCHVGVSSVREGSSARFRAGVGPSVLGECRSTWVGVRGRIRPA